MFNMKEVESLSKKYNIPQADILLIALNRYGIRANIDDNRIRFKIHLDIYDEIFYFAICVNTCETPFDIVNIPLHFFFTKSFKLLVLMYHSIVFV